MKRIKWNGDARGRVGILCGPQPGYILVLLVELALRNQAFTITRKELHPR